MIAGCRAGDRLAELLPALGAIGLCLAVVMLS